MRERGRERKINLSRWFSDINLCIQREKKNKTKKDNFNLNEYFRRKGARNERERRTNLMSDEIETRMNELEVDEDDEIEEREGRLANDVDG